jgi:aminopeptidase N
MRCGSALCALAATAALAVSPLAGTAAAMGDGFRPGSASIGDPYFPGDGNGGYDVQHYDLALSYRPTTDLLEGTATITAETTHDLSRFNLDLSGLTVRSVRVEGRRADWGHRGDELVVTPAQGIREGRTFTTVITYDGVPQPLTEFGGLSGFIHTDDGALVVGQPHVADTWFPSNDHPSDKASFHFTVKVPKGLTVVANGELESRRTSGGWTTWVWDAQEPMATYLATASVGDFDTTRLPAREPAASWPGPALPTPPTSGSAARSKCRPVAPPCPSG